MPYDEAIRTLIHLIEINKEAAKGFQTLSDGVSQKEFKTLFRLYARQRAGFAETLKQQVRRLGGDTKAETLQSMTDHAKAKLHHARADRRAAMSRGSRHAMLVEAERGEDVAIKHYEQAMRSGLPAALQRLVREQYEGVREAHRRLRELRDTTAQD